MSIHWTESTSWPTQCRTRRGTAEQGGRCLSLRKTPTAQNVKPFIRGKLAAAWAAYKTAQCTYVEIFPEGDRVVTPRLWLRLDVLKPNKFVGICSHFEHSFHRGGHAAKWDTKVKITDVLQNACHCLCAFAQTNFWAARTWPSGTQRHSMKLKRLWYLRDTVIGTTALNVYRYANSKDECTGVLPSRGLLLPYLSSSENPGTDTFHISFEKSMYSKLLRHN